MISIKELDYVNLWANKVPYPGEDYCNDVKLKLQNAFNLFNSSYANKKYNISFSNNEEIEFQILSKNICHMLGIDYKNLSGEYFKNVREEIFNINSDTNISSYELLECVVDNIDKVIKYDSSHNSRILNYYKVLIKCEIFSKLADLSNFNYGCINFDKEIYLKNNPDIKFQSNATKFLYTPSDEIVSSHFMMGLKKDEFQKYNYDSCDEEFENESESSSYIVETLIAPQNVRIPSFFKDQQVIIPTQIITDDNGILVKKWQHLPKK